MSRAGLDGLLRHLPGDVRTLVEQSFVPVTYEFGDVIVREGDPADALYVINSGQARVVVSGTGGQEVLLETFGPGDSFGEVGLLDDRAVRTASVRARGEVEAMRLDGVVFRALVATNPEVREAAELAARDRSLRTFLRVQSCFRDLDADALAALVDATKATSLDGGTTLLRPGARTRPLVIVHEGRFEVRRGNELAARLGPGDTAGATWPADDRVSVRASTAARLLVVGPEELERLAREHPAVGEVIALEQARRAAQPVDLGIDLSHELLPAEAVTTDVVVEEIDDAAPAPPRARIRSFPHVWQVDAADCGAASVAMVCRHFGRKVALSRVRDALRTSHDGTSLRAIATGSERLGLAARTVKASKRSLDSLELPALLHWDGNHWVVLYAVDGGTARIADPAMGIRKLRREEVLERWSGYAAMLRPTPALAEVPEDGIGLGWLAPFFRGHRGTIVGVLALGLVLSALQLSLPLFTRTIVDEVVANRDLSLLNLVLTAMGAAVVAMAVGAVAQRTALSMVALRVDGAALDDVATRLFALPLRYFLSRRTGDIQRRLMGVRQAREFVVHSGVAVFNGVIELLAALALMFFISRVLALTYLAGLPLVVLLMRYAGRRIRPAIDTLEEAFGRYSSRQIDALRGIESVKALGAEEALRRQLVTEFSTLSQRLYRADVLTMLYDAAIQLLMFMFLGVFFWVGALQVLEGNLTIGGLVSFSALVALANGPVGLLLTTWDQAQQASVLVDRLGDVFAQEAEQADPDELVRTELTGAVELRGLTFRYDPDAPPILDDINLRVDAGTTVAVVGRSGSGKTTLARCLAGLLEPTGGQILYDGIDLTTFDYRALRRQIGVVLQESFLFSDTIAANIAFGDAEPDRQRILWAARVANAHDFVNRLPLGYETRVGESGLLLSGGQRQRIAIARAIYRRPPVLILDEATSSLDAESERAVQENMARLLQGRTSFVIAHRLSTIRDADLVIVVDQGRLVEQGTHAQLMARQGLYFYLASEQLGV